MASRRRRRLLAQLQPATSRRARSCTRSRNIADGSAARSSRLAALSLPRTGSAASAPASGSVWAGVRGIGTRFYVAHGRGAYERASPRRWQGQAMGAGVFRATCCDGRRRHRKLWWLKSANAGGSVEVKRRACHVAVHHADVRGQRSRDARVRSPSRAVSCCGRPDKLSRRRRWLRGGGGCRSFGGRGRCCRLRCGSGLRRCAARKQLLAQPLEARGNALVHVHEGSLVRSQLRSGCSSWGRCRSGRC
jgi:hypothetical protein